MVQKYLNGVKYGDKRVFIINGKICGHKGSQKKFNPQ